MRPYEDTKRDSDKLVRDEKANLALEYMERAVEQLNNIPTHAGAPVNPEREAERDAAIVAWVRDPALFYDDWQAARRVGTQDFMSGNLISWASMSQRQRALAVTRQRASIMRRDLP